MVQISNRTVLTDGGEIRYHLERKPVKNLNLRIRKDGNVYVSANPAVPISAIDDFVRSKSDFIYNALHKFELALQFRPQPKQYVSGETFYIQGRGLRLQVTQAAKDSVTSDGVYLHLATKTPEDFEKKKRMVSKYLDLQCRTIFEEILDELYPVFAKYHVNRPVLRIRNMETRWGSCLAGKGIITLNKQLLEAPRNCIEYVVMHELCHLVHPNHSKHFYAFLSTQMPDWKDRKDLLERTAAYWL